MTKISLILAIDENGLVGNTKSKFGLPWHYKEDLIYYKNMTQHKMNIMGKNTYNAIGYALPNRETIVLSTTLKSLEDASVVSDISDILKIDTKEIMITGGPSVFKSFIPYADTFYITRILKYYEGDVFYKDLDLTDFKLIESRLGENKDLVFETWERNANFRPRD